MSNFYGTEIEICAGFWPVGSTKNFFGPIMNNFCGQFFPVLIVKKKDSNFLFKNYSNRAEKLHKMNVKKVLILITNGE